MARRRASAWSRPYWRPDPPKKSPLEEYGEAVVLAERRGYALSRMAGEISTLRKVSESDQKRLAQCQARIEAMAAEIFSLLGERKADRDRIEALTAEVASLKARRDGTPDRAGERL